MTNTSQGSPRTSIVAISVLPPALNKMIQSGYVNGDQVKQAQLESRKSGKRLTEVLEALTGQPLPPELLRLYKKQQMFERKIVYGVEAYDPEMSEMSNEQLGIMLDGLKISIDICHQGRFLPVAKTETEPQAVLVAMVDPDNLNAIEDLRRILQPHGLALQRRVITPDDYQDITSAYQDDQVKVAAKIAEADKQRKLELGEGDFGELSLEEESADQEDLANTIDDAEAAPVIKAVNIILAKALSEKVSDIHVEPQEEFMRIRMRKDGVLQEYFRFPKQVVQSITARFKIIANLDIAERRQAQDGRIRRVFEGRTVDFRVNSLPSRYGEKIVLRILDSSSTQLGLGLLISDQETLALVRET
ncbi:MAG: type II/IV secretion system protein, partial [Oscillatoriales cyanobacterium]